MIQPTTAYKEEGKTQREIRQRRRSDASTYLGEIDKLL